MDFKLRLHAGEASTSTAEVCWRGSAVAAAALPRYARWLEDRSTDTRVGAPALLIRNTSGVGDATGTQGQVMHAYPYPVDLCVTLFAVEGANVTKEIESLVAFVNATTSPELVMDGCSAPGATFYEWESRCGALKTGVDGDNGYMASGVLLSGALDDGKAATALVQALAATPGDRTIINFHDGGGAIRQEGHGGSFPHRNFNLIYQVVCTMNDECMYCTT